MGIVEDGKTVEYDFSNRADKDTRKYIGPISMEGYRNQSDGSCVYGIQVNRSDFTGNEPSSYSNGLWIYFNNSTQKMIISSKGEGSIVGFIFIFYFMTNGENNQGGGGAVSPVK